MTNRTLIDMIKTDGHKTGDVQHLCVVHTDDRFVLNPHEEPKHDDWTRTADLLGMFKQFAHAWEDA